MRITPALKRRPEPGRLWSRDRTWLVMHGERVIGRIRRVGTVYDAEAPEAGGLFATRREALTLIIKAAQAADWYTGPQWVEYPPRSIPLSPRQDR